MEEIPLDPLPWKKSRATGSRAASRRKGMEAGGEGSTGSFGHWETEDESWVPAAPREPKEEPLPKPIEGWDPQIDGPKK